MKIQKISFSKEIKTKKHLYVLMLPGIIYMFIMYYLPMFGIIIAFKSYNPIAGIIKSPFCGLDNFKFFFRSSAALKVTINTLLYNSTFIIFGISISLLFAILFNELKSNKITSIFKSIILLPYLISWVIASYTLFAILSPDKGILNSVISIFNINPISFYMESSYWRFIIPISYLWKNLGYVMIIFLAGITSIQKSYYEAAEIDGANSLQKAIHITIPLLTPIAATFMLLQVGKIFFAGFGDWGLFYNLPQDSGMTYATTDVIDTYIYRSLRQLNDFGMSSAVGFYQSSVGCILVIITNSIIKKFNPEGALF